MNQYSKIVLECKGVNIGKLYLPEFTLSKGEYVCLHLPQGITLEDKYVEALTKILRCDEETFNIRVLNQALRVYPYCRRSGWFDRLRFHNRKIISYLTKELKIPEQEALNFLEELKIMPSEKLDWFSLPERIVVALFDAFRKSDFIVYSTAGLGGGVMVYDFIQRKLFNKAIINLSYQPVQGSRICANYGRCIDCFIVD
jgi:hypothetical protein